MWHVYDSPSWELDQPHWVLGPGSHSAPDNFNGTVSSIKQISDSCKYNIINSAKEGFYCFTPEKRSLSLSLSLSLSVSLRLPSYLSVCLSVCKQESSKRYWWIDTKFAFISNQGCKHSISSAYKSTLWCARFLQVVALYVFALCTTVAIAFLSLTSYRSFVFGELIGVCEYNLTFYCVLCVNQWVGTWMFWRSGCERKCW